MAKRKFDESKVKRDESGRFVASSKGVKNKGLLTKEERKRLKPSSKMQGAAIRHIPGESPEKTRKRAQAAAKKFRSQMKKK
jgi:hypothetical protein